MHAAFDIGSNTLRMLLGDCPAGQLTAYRYERRITRLAGNMAESGELAEASIARTCTALAELADIARNEQAESLRAVGTAALRRATNREAVLARLQRDTGLRVRVVTGSEEAALTVSGVLTILNPLPERALIVDIGGGSTELMLTSDAQLLCQRSYPLGVVRLCEQYAGTPAQENSAVRDMIDDFRELMPDPPDPVPLQLVATAGTATTLAAMHLQLARYRADTVNNHYLPRAWLEATRKRLIPMTVAQREQLPGMEQGRGDLILPGLRILLALMDTFAQDHLKISDAGLLEGLLCSPASE